MPGPSGRVLQGVTGVAVVTTLSLLAPDGASAETVSAGVLALLVRLWHLRLAPCNLTLP